MPKRRAPPVLPDEPSDPAIRAFTEKVLGLFAERCAVFKLDPGSEDFWRLMSYAFAFEHLLAECRPPTKAKQTKPQRWGTRENEQLLANVGKQLEQGKTVADAIKTLRLRNLSGNQKSLETRFYEAQKLKRRANREKIAEIISRKSSPTNTGRDD